MPISTTEQILAQKWTLREMGDANTYTVMGDDWIMSIRMNGHPAAHTQRELLGAVVRLPELLVALRDAADHLELIVARDQQKLLDVLALEKAQAILSDLKLPIPMVLP